jgi:hypothetical protein
MVRRIAFWLLLVFVMPFFAIVVALFWIFGRPE